jgi:2-polyprenyl-6-methoxyphenol hydroxylase-like FAD-dependent oxidoreductase
MADRDSRAVVIVGAGIAGGALGTMLARSGVEVTLLERQGGHRDRVRGEYLAPWGAAEALEANLMGVLCAPGDHAVATRYIPYDEVHAPDVAEARGIALDRLLPGVPGAIHLSHPGACRALVASARAAGAVVLQGVSDVAVRAGRAPVVRFRHAGRARELHCRLVVGADGRGSAVRTQLGLSLHATMPRTVGVGLLVGGVRGWPDGAAAIGTEDGHHFFVFPRGGGLARLYLLVAPALRRRYTGEGAAGRVLATIRALRSLPRGVDLDRTVVRGPCAAFPMNDSWTRWPLVEGALLVGDAAGYNDPIIGQGLSLALRDARVVAQLLAGGSDWSPRALRPYADGRHERMRRLRITAELMTRLRCTFTPEGRERRRRVYERFAADPAERRPLAASLVGPDAPAAEVFSPAAGEWMLR